MVQRASSSYNQRVRRVEEIESEVKQLSPTEFANLRRRGLLKDGTAWDLQFEQDAVSGRLDELFGPAETDYKAGNSREILQ